MRTLALPQQIGNLSEERTAIAPYNFVPLPEQVVPAEEVAEEQRVRLSLRHNGTLEEVEFPCALRQDRYYQEDQGRYTGHINCTLTTASPLYVRCALTLKQFEQSEREKVADEGENSQAPRDFRSLAKNTPEFFYTNSTEMPVIPGSSLRGMLRALVEIVSYSQMEKISHTGGYFFRAVAAKGDDPLTRPYRDLLKNVRAGYLVRDGEGWAIQPARTLNGDTFIKVRERDIPPTVGLVKMHNRRDYHPQYIEVSFTTKVTGNGRTVIELIDRPGVYSAQGWLVTSGNMIETGSEGTQTPRKNHCVVLPPIQGVPLSIDRQAVEDYRAGLTEFQRSTPFSKRDGVLGVKLNHPVPVFYCEPPRGQKVIFFGHSPNFRIPYWPRGADHALAPADFVPRDLRDRSHPDLAEAIFGFVRDEEQPFGVEQVRAGRIFVSDALFQSEPGSAWLDENGAVIVPHILSSPKPTTFQHYLVQTSSQKRDLRHYASTRGSETVIRGHKLYWHKGTVGRRALEDADFLQQPEKEQQRDTQHTQFRPVKAGMTFTFHLHFENLSRVELGALLWVLNIAADDNYRLKLGMGKPLGMGAVKITHTVHLTNRSRRYGQLFDGQGWATGAMDAMTPEAERPFADEFEHYVLKHSGEKAQTLRKTLRIQCLLALLAWPGPPPEQTRYMKIERDVREGYIPAAKPVRPNDSTVNEYRDRPVLPTPLQVIGAPLAPAVSTAQPHPEMILPQASPPNPQPQIVVPAIGDIITGNRSGAIRNPIRGVKVDINRTWYQVPPDITVIGIIRAEDAGGQVSGGFKGEIIHRKDEQRIIYLFLKPVKATTE